MPPKPTNTEGQVPDAAVEAILNLNPTMEPDMRNALRPTIRRELAAALPSLEDSFKERVREALLGDEALRAAEDAQDHFSASMLRSIIGAALDVALSGMVRDV